MINIILL